MDEDDNPGAEGLPKDEDGGSLAAHHSEDHSVDREFAETLEQLVPVTVPGEGRDHESQGRVEGGSATAGAAAAVLSLSRSSSDSCDGDGNFVAATVTGSLRGRSDDLSIETVHLHVPNFRIEDLAADVRGREEESIADVLTRSAKPGPEKKDANSDQSEYKREELAQFGEAKIEEQSRAATRAKPILRTFSPEKQKQGDPALVQGQVATEKVAQRVKPRGFEGSRNGHHDLKSSRTSILMEERHFRRQLLRETMRRMERDPDYGASSSYNTREQVQRSSSGGREAEELSALYKEWHDKLQSRENRNETNERAILQQMAKLAERSLSLHIYEKELSTRRARAKADLEHREGALRAVQSKIEAKLEEVEATEQRNREWAAGCEDKEEKLKAFELTLRERETALAVREKVLGKKVEEAKKAAGNIERRQKTVSEQAQIGHEDALSAKLRLRELHEIALNEVEKRKTEAREREQRVTRREEAVRGKEADVEAEKEIARQRIMKAQVMEESAKTAIKKAEEDTAAARLSIQMQKDEIARAQNAKTEAEKALSKAQSERSNAEASIEKSSAKLKKVVQKEKEIEQKEKELADKAAALEANHAKIEEAERESRSVFSRKEQELSTERTTWEHKLKSMEQELAEAVAARENAEKQLFIQTTEHETSEKVSAEKMRQVEAERDQERNTFRREVENIESLLEHERADLRKERVRIKELEDEVHALSLGNKRAKAEVEETSGQLSLAKNRIIDLEQNLKSQSEKTINMEEEARKVLRTALNEAEQLRSDLTRREDDLKYTREQLDSSKKYAEELSTSLQEAQRDQRTVKIENDVVSSKLEALTTKAAADEKAMQVEREGTGRKIARLEGEIETLHQTIVELRGKIQLGLLENARMTEAAEEKEEQIKKLGEKVKSLNEARLNDKERRAQELQRAAEEAASLQDSALVRLRRQMERKLLDKEGEHAQQVSRMSIEHEKTKAKLAAAAEALQRAEALHEEDAAAVSSSKEELRARRESFVRKKDEAAHSIEELRLQHKIQRTQLEADAADVRRALQASQHDAKEAKELLEHERKALSIAKARVRELEADISAIGGTAESQKARYEERENDLQGTIKKTLQERDAIATDLEEAKQELRAIRADLTMKIKRRDDELAQRDAALRKRGAEILERDRKLEVCERKLHEQRFKVDESVSAITPLRARVNSMERDKEASESVIKKLQDKLQTKENKIAKLVGRSSMTNEEVDAALHRAKVAEDEKALLETKLKQAQLETGIKIQAARLRAETETKEEEAAQRARAVSEVEDGYKAKLADLEEKLRRAELEAEKKSQMVHVSELERVRSEEAEKSRQQEIAAQKQIDRLAMDNTYLLHGTTPAFANIAHTARLSEERRRCGEATEAAAESKTETKVAQRALQELKLALQKGQEDSREVTAMRARIGELVATASKLEKDVEAASTREQALQQQLAQLSTEIKASQVARKELEAEREKQELDRSRSQAQLRKLQEELSSASMRAVEQETVAKTKVELLHNKSQEVVALHTEIIDLKHEISQGKENVAQIARELGEKTAQCNAQIGTISSLEMKIRNLEENIGELKTKIGKLETRDQALVEREQQLEREAESAIRNSELSKEREREKIDRIKVLEADLSQAKEDRDENKRKWKVAEASETSTRDALAKLRLQAREANALWREERKAQAFRLEALREKIASLEERNATRNMQCKNALAEAASRLQEANARCEIMEKSLGLEQTKIKTESERVARASDEKRTLERRVVELETQIKEKKEQDEKAKKTIEDLEKKLSSEASKRSELQRRLAEFHGLVEVAKEAETGLKERVAELKRELHTVRVELAEANGARERLHEQVVKRESVLREKTELLSNTISNLDREKEDLEQRLARLAQAEKRSQEGVAHATRLQRDVLERQKRVESEETRVKQMKEKWMSHWKLRESALQETEAAAERRQEELRRHELNRTLMDLDELDGSASAIAFGPASDEDDLRKLEASLEDFREVVEWDRRESERGNMAFSEFLGSNTADGAGTTTARDGNGSNLNLARRTERAVAVVQGLQSSISRFRDEKLKDRRRKEKLRFWAENLQKQANNVDTLTQVLRRRLGDAGGESKRAAETTSRKQLKSNFLQMQANLESTRRIISSANAIDSPAPVLTPKNDDSATTPAGGGRVRNRKAAAPMEWNDALGLSPAVSSPMLSVEK